MPGSSRKLSSNLGQASEYFSAVISCRPSANRARAAAESVCADALSPQVPMTERAAAMQNKAPGLCARMTHFGSLHRSTSAFLELAGAAEAAGGAEAASDAARGGRAGGFGGGAAWPFCAEVACDATVCAATVAAAFLPGRAPVEPFAF